MKRTTEDPITTTENRHGSEESTTTHPAFAQIVASRVQGSACLYGSDFIHHNYIEIRISRSELHRSLNRDWHYPRNEIISVKVSEAQWATFVSAMNIGGGVPCTLDHIEHVPVPMLPDPKPRVDQFEGEVAQKLAKVMATLSQLSAAIEQEGLPKGKAERLKGRVATAQRELGANLPFVAKSFSGHMESEVEKAKTEIHGYMTAVVQRAGLDAITGGQLPLQIERKSKEGE